MLWYFISLSSSQPHKSFRKTMQVVENYQRHTINSTTLNTCFYILLLYSNYRKFSFAKKKSSFSANSLSLSSPSLRISFLCLISPRNKQSFAHKLPSLFSIFNYWTFQCLLVQNKSLTFSFMIFHIGSLLFPKVTHPPFVVW